MPGIVFRVTHEQASRAMAYADAMISRKAQSQDVHRGQWIPNVRMEDRRKNQVIGAIGEQAVAQYFGVELDYSLEYNRKRPDFVVQGLRIDVKSTPLHMGRLIIPVDHELTADVVVLVRGVVDQAIDQFVELAGWIPAAEAKAGHREEESPWGRKCVTDARDLRPMSTLLQEAIHAQSAPE